MKSALLSGPINRTATISGFFTSLIGSGTVVEGSSVEHSVILNNSNIYSIERLEDSIISKNTKVTHSDKGFKITRLFIGDDAKVEL